jgi:hypothetical protein
LIHHHILQLHNSMEFAHDKALWNYGFLASGILFIGDKMIYDRRYYPVRLDRV